MSSGFYDDERLVTGALHHAPWLASHAERRNVHPMTSAVHLDPHPDPHPDPHSTPYSVGASRVGSLETSGGSRFPLASIGAVATGSMVALCVVGLALVTGVRLDAAPDGAGAVPIIALIGIAVAIIRWHPAHHLTPVRGIARSMAVGLAAAAIVLVASVLLDPARIDLYTGAAITSGLSAGYLLAWGYRSVALLRTVVLLSLLTWGPIANAAHTIVRSSLEQPSDLIYQRLAQFQQFGVHDEPWRIFTASLHRGSLVVIAAVVLTIAASRWRLSPRMFVDLGVTAAVALVLHHVVVLWSPIDTYDPSQADQLATQPTMEIAIATIAVLLLGAVRWRRQHRSAAIPTTSPVASSTVSTVATADRDPVIFSSVGAPQPRTTTCLLAIGVLPLLVLVATT